MTQESRPYADVANSNWERAGAPCLAQGRGYHAVYGQARGRTDTDAPGGHPDAPRRTPLARTEAACYHVLNRGHARETIFHDDDDRVYFLKLLARYRDSFDLRLYHYCLMDNHFHLLLQLAEAEQLSRMAAGLLVSYWHHYRRRYGLVGHLFQGRFKSPAVEAEPYLLSCGRYIERNPLEAGLVALPWEYCWSSCRAYALGEADGLLAPNPWYEALSPVPGRRQELWREFLLGEDPKEAEVRREGWVVGSAAFRQQLRRRRSRPAPRGRGRPIGGAGATTGGIIP